MCSSTPLHNSFQRCQALSVFFSDHILLLANKTFGQCLSKHCLDHDGLENLSQKILPSVLKRGICALCKSACLNFRHNCIGEKPKKNRPVNCYQLVENMFLRWSEGAKQQQMTVLEQIQCSSKLQPGGFSRVFYWAAVGKHSRLCRRAGAEIYVRWMGREVSGKGKNLN